MKKILFLLILCSIIAGCSSTEILNISQGHVLTDPKNSIVIGNFSIEGIPGEFSNAVVRIAHNDWEAAEFPITVLEGVQKDSPSTGHVKTDFYFFVEMPSGYYEFKEASVEHKIFKTMKFYMLNANVTIPESSIVYIGTLQVKPIGRTLNLLGPTTEMRILDDPKSTVRLFRERYPEYAGQGIKSNVMSRYGLFKEGGVGGVFD